MNYELQIIDLVDKHNGYITTKQVEDNNIPRRFLSFLVNKKIIERISRGVYSKNDEIEDDLLVIQSKSKYAIFSNLTALYFYGLCSRTPEVIDVSVINGYKGTLQNYKNVSLYYNKKETHELGISTIESNFGNDIKVYDIERSICDIIKNKKRIDKELFNQAIRGYWRTSDKNMVKLYGYATKLNVYKKVKTIFEVLS